MARTKKWVIYGAIAGVLAAGYAIYAVFFLERVPIGALCKSSGDCEGQCVGFGDLLPDYSHKEMCTRECSAAADCPAPTSCREVELISTDGTGVEKKAVRYCLPAQLEK